MDRRQNTGSVAVLPRHCPATCALLLTHGHYTVRGEIKSRHVDPQPRRDHEQGGGAGLLKLDFFRFRLFLNNSATDIVLVTLPKHGS